MSFILDHQLSSSAFEIADWPLCRILLKDNAEYPWLILVPRQNNIREIIELSLTDQHQLMQEISQLSTLMNDYFKPHKLNIGTLGNIVSQLHIHIIARFTYDALWPQGVWQEALSHKPYTQSQKRDLIRDLQSLVNIMEFRQTKISG